MITCYYFCIALFQPRGFFLKLREAFYSFDNNISGSSGDTSQRPKIYNDLTNAQYEIGENVYEKSETEIPLENINAYEQLLADISLNEIGSVIINKGKDSADEFKRELSVRVQKILQT